MLRFIPLLIIFSFITGCAWIDDIGESKSKAEIRILSTETVDSDLLDDHVQCNINQFPLKLTDFNADEPIENSARIRMYESIEESLRTNYLMISFEQFDAEKLTACPKTSELEGQTFEITTNGCVQAQFQFNRCKDHTTSRFLGTITLSKFSLKRGERISGTLAGQLVDVSQVHTTTDHFERTTPFAQVEGEFDFVIHAGAVWNR